MPAYIKIVTPENIVIRYYLGGLVSRGKAFLHDLVMQFFLYIFMGAVLPEFFSKFHFSRSLFEGLLIAWVFGIFWGYHIFFEVFFNGQTPGKKALGLRVVTSNGQRVTFFQSVARNLLRIVDFLPVLFPVAVFSMLATRHHQRVGDVFSRTMVIRDNARVSLKNESAA